jgi:hypothetical protein
MSLIFQVAVCLAVISLIGALSLQDQRKIIALSLLGISVAVALVSWSGTGAINVGSSGGEETTMSPEEKARQRAIEEHEEEYREKKERTENRLVKKAPIPDDALMIDMKGEVPIPDRIIDKHEEQGLPIYWVFSNVGAKDGRGFLPQNFTVDGKKLIGAGATCYDITNLAKDGTINVQWNNPDKIEHYSVYKDRNSWMAEYPFISNQCTVNRIEE